MRIKSIDLNEIEFLSDFTKNLLEISSMDDIYKKIISIFDKSLPYDLAILYMFDFTERLVVRGHTGIEVNSEINADNTTNIQLIKTEFSTQGMRIYNNWGNRLELQKLFFNANQIEIVAIIPLITNNKILGFICIGSKEDYTFSKNETLLLEIIACIVSRNLGQLLMNELFSSQIQELQNIAKTMRHDFANDIQSIALSIELLLTTTLSEEQSKFIRLLGNAKNSAVKKIDELRNMKKKFEEDLEIPYGLSI